VGGEVAEGVDREREMGGKAEVEEAELLRSEFRGGEVGSG